MPSPEFEQLRSQQVSALNIGVEEYLHSKTGARHIHLSTADDNNAFLVAFLTVPQDSTGVAHILEHTALCGSKRFPVRDPFFLMLRRSLNTFMNAMTASDWTAYPFASRNKKDFNNLLEVYLDAAFFPTLDKLDFAQEGHRIEFSRADDPSSELEFKGVVFNEMKGAMSSPISTLWQNLAKHLYPTTTYHHNSGGDPEQIPELSWEQLTAFHSRHYHPSNSVFFTYGDIPAEDHQQKIHDLALNRFEKQAITFAVKDETRYEKPQRAEHSYAIGENEDPAEKTHIVLGWLLGNMTNLDTVLRTLLVSRVLLDNSASPLRRVLETTDLGATPSPLCGLDDSSREMLFACGLEGSEAERADEVEKLILDSLQQIAEQGVDQSEIEAVLHQIELSRREISGDRFPYGLQLMMSSLPVAIHGGDPVAFLAMEDALERLRSEIAKRDFMPNQIRELLLDNPHRVRLVMKPDPGLNHARHELERQKLEQIKASLDETQKQQVVALAASLKERQDQEDNVELLPKVGLKDVAADLEIAQGFDEPVGGIEATWFDRATNGLVYQQIVVDLPEMDPDLQDLLPLLTDCLPEMGSGGRDYLQTQKLQAAKTGGISASSSVNSRIHPSGSKGLFVVSGKALARNQQPLSELLLETLMSSSFTDLARIKELVAQIRMAEENSITGQGHALAMTAASAGMTPSAAIAHRWNGLQSIKTIKALDDSLDQEKNVQALAKQLQKLQQLIAQAPRKLLVISEQLFHEQIGEDLARCWSGKTFAANQPRLQFPQNQKPQQIQQAWCTSTQVNFCARAFPAVPADHPDAPALSILGGYLRNGFLHTAIREKGGAYGGGAGYDQDSASFRFFSYRDPRFSETLADFDHSVDWLLSTNHQERLLEEAILGVISTIDKPSSPAGAARSAYHAALHGKTPEFRRNYRQQVLDTSMADLLRVAETYLTKGNASTAVVTNSELVAEQKNLNLELIPL